MSEPARSVIETVLHGSPFESRRSGALLSADGRYRLALWRFFAHGVAPPLGFAGLNPSRADGLVDDNTIRRCLGFAYREGAGGVYMVNVSPWRATKPRDLFAAAARGEDVLLREDSNAQILLAAERCPRIVAAWGALRRPCPSWLHARVFEITSLLCFSRSHLVRLGTTKAGDPRHPLFVRGDAPLEAFA